MNTVLRWGMAAMVAWAFAGVVGAQTFALQVKPPAAPGQVRYMGQGAGALTPTPGSRSPTGAAIGYDNLSLIKDGKPWLPVMGEFHYSRYPANEWREELLKMKAGGISIAATYVFWIHHEEEQGRFDWAGQRNLREFVRLCGEVDMPVIVRMGPWCHGEVRNGGMPDWADAMPRKRSADPEFLAAVRPHYAQIAEQLKGQLWKDGGPVIGIQVDNEYGGTPAYLLALKNMARELGIDVPIYTRTGWPAPRAPYPYGELLPLFGGYAEGFWDRSLDSMPGNYWQAFTFSTERIDTAIASDIFGQQAVGTAAASETLSYPWLTCELGGGMMSSYHRRIKIHPMDVLSIPLTKVGAGSNLPGYYMYHGGTNPDGKTTDMMQETQSRGMWNDLPYKTYDFQSPLGEYGQVRESYHLLRHFHLFLRDFGPDLVGMTPTFPNIRNAKNNTTDLRFAFRSDGNRGFLFINNYQRGVEMPAKKDVEFELQLAARDTVIKVPPAGVLTVPANTSFVMPVNMDMGGATLLFATAQPVCRVEVPAVNPAEAPVFGGEAATYTFFTSIPGIEPSFVFEKGTTTELLGSQSTQDDAGRTHLTRFEMAAVRVPGGKKQVIVLLEGQRATRLYKGVLAGKERVMESPAAIVTEGNRLRLTARDIRDMKVNIYPGVADAELPPGSANYGNGGVSSGLDIRYPGAPSGGPFGTATQPMPSLPSPQVELLRRAGPLRTIQKGSTAQGVAEHPTTDDFSGNQPAIYRIKLPVELANLERGARALLRLHYAGDVARVYAGSGGEDKLLTDNYYNGDPMDIGLWRLPAGTTELTVKIIPLQKGAPIHLADWPDMQGQESIAVLHKAEIITERTVTLEVK